MSMAMRTEERTEFLRDVLTAAVAGGINGWAGLGNIVCTEELSVDSVLVWERADGDTTCTIPEQIGLGWGDACPGHPVGVETVARGLRLARDPKVKLNPVLREEINDADAENNGGEVDAGMADVIVQLGLFGQVTYG